MTDPSAVRRELDDLLRSCVQCGLCLPHCATWLATGNEVQSPRGRLVLLQELLSSGPEATPPEYLAAFDQCIGCHACQSACPSGVPFTLLEHGQHEARRRLGVRDLPEAQPALPGPLTGLLDRRPWLKAAGGAGRAARKVLTDVAGPRWRRQAEERGGPAARFARLLMTLPRTVERSEELLALLQSLEERSGAGRWRELPTRPAESLPESATPLAFFRGCASNALLSGASVRLLDLLRQLGCSARVPAGQECCGALASHTGRERRARRLQDTNRAAFGDLGPGERIVVEAAGCGFEWKQQYGPLADRVVDAVVLLAELPAPALGAIRLKVAIHDPCHARHGQGIVDEPRRLLQRIPGLTVIEPSEGEVCCGSGGAWGLRYPDLSDELGRRKARRLAETGADLIVTSNPGCLGQITDGLALEAPDLPILLLTDLYWASARRALGQGVI